MVWRWPSLALVPFAAVALLWRRTHPAGAVLLVFGATLVANIASLVAGVVWDGLYAMAVVLIVLYALARWGSGREIMVGSALLVVLTVVDILGNDPVLVSEVIGGFVVLGVVVEAGISVRLMTRARTQAVEQARLGERATLARELHDTVAHHVSAIAIQAQAGRAVATADPERSAEVALDALAVIEREASQTLAEMRTMVGALRDGEAVAFAPQPGVGELTRLAGSVPGREHRLPVDVELDGDLSSLRPTVDAALYRLAQESVTNAFRHARNATRVLVRVSGDDEVVRLVVDDDGETGVRSGSTEAQPDADPAGVGFGLVGMAERVKLLGGSFEAGPGEGRGWIVSATLPRHGGLL
jgi:signal transduction histidine kinase